MPNRRAYSLVEVVVTVSLIVMVIALLLPAIGGTRGHHHHRPMQNNTQTRGIQSALVLYASGNNTYYVGLDSKGDITDGTTEGRFQELLDEAYFTGEYLISPTETLKPWTTGRLRADQYSYALLDITQPTDGDDTDTPRRIDEWKDTINTEAIVVTDRNTGSASTNTYQSVWTTEPGEWKGSVAWNDNHVTFEATATGLATKYATQQNKADDLFQADGPADAVMIHSGE